MIARAMFKLVVPVVSIILLTAVPESGQAQMDCVACHDIHNSPGGTLNTAAEFDLICDSCHGPAGTAIFADRHVDPSVNEASGNTGKPEWEIGCITCHTPHGTDAVNHLYDNGTQHAHTLGGDSGNLVDGINIKLFGHNEDGTGIAKIATPLRINDVDSAGPCTNSNTEVEVFLPPFSDGEGPPATIMVGDRITINNGGAEFDGSFRVKETNWDGIQDTTPTGWVCFDRPTTATYDPTGFVRSTGWHKRPRIRKAVWALGTATLNLNDGYSIRVGDTIDVSGVSEVNPGTFNGLKTVTAVTNTSVTAASWSAGTATLTLAENHLYQAGEQIEVADVISAGLEVSTASLRLRSLTDRISPTRSQPILAHTAIMAALLHRCAHGWLMQYSTLVRATSRGARSSTSVRSSLFKAWWSLRRPARRRFWSLTWPSQRAIDRIASIQSSSRSTEIIHFRKMRYSPSQG